jgi:hypothetical protein
VEKPVIGETSAPVTMVTVNQDSNRIPAHKLDSAVIECKQSEGKIAHKGVVRMNAFYLNVYKMLISRHYDFLAGGN